MMTDDQILEVVSAHKEGKKIEYSWGSCVNWYEFLPQDKWNFDRYVFRVAPEPHKPREWVTNVINGEIQGSGHRITNVTPVVENNVRVREVLE
jgi:hypothetical protein